MKLHTKDGQFRFALVAALAALCLGFAGTPVRAQVSPAEIVNPELRSLESQYFNQLKQISHDVAATHFPFSFFLSRYVGVDPAKQVETDARGLEFVKFHDQVILKVTGNYNAAYNAGLMTQNEQAAGTFRDVILPIARLVTEQISQDVACDGIGFEISYHSRTMTRGYDYEGKSILVVVLPKPEALALVQAADDATRQEILNASQVYVNGKTYGLSLTGATPLVLDDIQAHQNSVSQPAAASSYLVHKPLRLPSSGTSPSGTRAAVSPAVAPVSVAPTASSPANSLAAAHEPVAASPVMVQADADKLQAQFQPQLDTLAKEGATKFHLVDFAPPSFVVFQNHIALQVTARNPARFDANATSIYRRSAQSFDLFLAPMLKDLLAKTPACSDSDWFDFTVVNQLASADPHSGSEAVEYISPAKAARQFANAEITNQQLLDQSVVLVNGVRIALNLQMVE
jgi:hypothetical protein